MAQKPSPPKRRYPRIAIAKGLCVAWHGGGQRTVSRIRTLGMGGVFIYTPTPPGVGTIVKMIFEIPGGEVRARAMVRSVELGQGMGVEFTGMTHEHRAWLHQLLNRLLR